MIIQHKSLDYFLCNYQLVNYKHKYDFFAQISRMKTLSIFLQELKAPDHSDKCIFMFITAKTIKGKSWKQPMHPSTDQWNKA